MISIILPWVRKTGYNKCLSALFDAVQNGTHFEVVAERDTERIGCNPMVNKLVDKSRYDIVCFMHDDSEPQFGCVEAALAAMNSFPGGFGCVGFNDLHHGADGPPTHWMIHKKMLKYFSDGVFYSEEYHHTKVDQELKDVCDEVGLYKWARGARVVHHSRVNKGIKFMDDLALSCYGRTQHDKEVYERRKLERNAK